MGENNLAKEIVYFEDIAFIRDKRKILSDINWTIKAGENWALLGLNGSGKSTLLAMIPAYTIPSRGKMRVFGHSFGHYVWPKIRKRVGFVSSMLDRYITTLLDEIVLEIVISGKFNSIGLYEEYTEEDVKRAEEIMDDFGIAELRNHSFKTISQGEQRRTLIARAFMSDPDLMILDEPCTGLDIRAREYLLRTLNNLSDLGSCPFIYVTHRIEEIIPAITHVALLDSDGTIMVKGKKEEIITEENLKKLYSLDLKIIWENGRPWLISLA